MNAHSRALLRRWWRKSETRKTSRSDDHTAARAQDDSDVSQRILLEELEQRLLLSADLNPVAGAIAVPGETDVFVFTLNERQTVYFDNQTSVPGLNWSLAGPSGAEVTNQPLNTADSTATPPVLSLGSGDYKLSVSGAGESTCRARRLGQCYILRLDIPSPLLSPRH
jgi:hypothetical protein